VRTLSGGADTRRSHTSSWLTWIPSRSDHETIELVVPHLLEHQAAHRSPTTAEIAGGGTSLPLVTWGNPGLPDLPVVGSPSNSRHRHLATS
jgi:hypothetical protein